MKNNWKIIFIGLPFIIAYVFLIIFTGIKSEDLELRQLVIELLGLLLMFIICSIGLYFWKFD